MSMGNLEKCEPNLIPMLDLVLQLIMFFMLVTNFIADDLNESVKLPHALQARPIDKNEDYVITLNMDRKGRVLLMKGNEKEIDEALEKNPNDPRVLTNKLQVRGYMANKWKADRERRDAKVRAGQPEPKPALVVLRAHQDSTYKLVNEVLEGCRMAGFLDVQLRAVVGRGPQK